MSQLCGPATGQFFAQFAQYLYMCTPKLEKSCIFTIFTCFWHVFTPFMLLFEYFLLIFLRKICKSKVLTAQENQQFECLIIKENNK